MAELDPRRLPARLGSARPLVEMWTQGGARLARPLERPAGPPAEVSLLLQPDGDVVLRVPTSFGTAPSDKVVFDALLDEAGSLLRGHEGLAAGIGQLLTYATGAALAASAAAAPGHTPEMMTAAASAVGLRIGAGFGLRALVGGGLSRIIRNRLSPPAGGAGWRGPEGISAGLR